MRLVGEETIECLWIDDPYVPVASWPFLLDVPAGKHHDWSHSDLCGSSIIQQTRHPPRLCSGLSQRIVERPLTRNPDGIAVVHNLGILVHRFGSRFCFDGENPGRTDNDMVHVEIRPRNVMQHPIALCSKRFKHLSHRPFTVSAEPKILNRPFVRPDPLPGVDDQDEGRCAEKCGIRWD